MKLYYVLFVSITLLSSSYVNSQYSLPGGGKFPQYALAGITKITQYQIQCNENGLEDTNYIKSLEYDEEGYLVFESYGMYKSHGIYNRQLHRFKYTYNKKGFLTDIDTLHEIFGHGYGSGGPDTTFTTETTLYEQFGNTNRPVKTSWTNHTDQSSPETYYEYDSIGRIRLETLISSYYHPTMIYTSHVEYDYTEDGFLKEMRLRNDENIIESKTIYIYTKIQK